MWERLRGDGGEGGRARKWIYDGVWPLAERFKTVPYTIGERGFDKGALGLGFSQNGQDRSLHHLRKGIVRMNRRPCLVCTS